VQELRPQQWWLIKYGYKNSKTGRTVMAGYTPQYVILLHTEGEPSFIARQSFNDIGAASDHLNAQLQNHKELKSGRIYELKNHELIKIMDITREVITRVTYHVQNTTGVV
jgi:hypothetical protein